MNFDCPAMVTTNNKW